MTLDLPATLLALLLHLFPACPTEDSAGCGWNAQEQGNGRGASFIALSDNLILN
jgi:hypothetical protein